MASEVLSFYKNKNVFITGGTGFLGKVLIEKLLRTTQVERIYVLARTKRGRDISERIDDMFNDPLFATLKRVKPEVNHAKRVITVSGDCALPNLGLSAVDAKTLIERIEVVIHGAATVRFDEPLSYALAINLCATMDLIALAKQMPRLKAFIHVSSAFANCTVSNIEERFYVDRIGISSAEICERLQKLGNTKIDGLWDELRGDFPNTYCFSKALAEEAILTLGRQLPISVFRPGIVIPTCTEPVPGWVDNLYGPTSILLGVACGVMRVFYGRMQLNASVVPVDFCSNEILACAWHCAQVQRVRAEPPIYNLVPEACNQLKWSDYKRALEESGKEMPLSRMAWYPFLISTDSRILYAVLSFCFHTLPGYVLDLGLLLVGQKRRMVKAYDKIHKNNEMLRYFVDNEWTFSMRNTEQLWQLMLAEDRQLFPFDMRSIDWRRYFQDSVAGMRLYLAKEDPQTIPKGLKLMKRFLIIHRTLQTVFYGGALLLAFWTSKRILTLILETI